MCSLETSDALLVWCWHRLMKIRNEDVFIWKWVLEPLWQIQCFYLFFLSPPDVCRHFKLLCFIPNCVWIRTNNFATFLFECILFVTTMSSVTAFVYSKFILVRGEAHKFLFINMNKCSRKKIKMKMEYKIENHSLSFLKDFSFYSLCLLWEYLFECIHRRLPLHRAAARYTSRYIHERIRRYRNSSSNLMMSWLMNTEYIVVARMLATWCVYEHSALCMAVLWMLYCVVVTFRVYYYVFGISNCHLFIHLKKYKWK